MGHSKLVYDDYIEHMDAWGIDIPKWSNELSVIGYKSVCAIDFYDDIFGEDLEEERMPDDYKTGEYGGIAVEKIKKLDKNGKIVLNKKEEPMYIGRRYTITKGNFELYDLIDKSENFCMIAPISYAGRTRKNENARYMYALCIEVDHIEPKNGIRELVYSWERKTKPLPKPTYIVCSGNGLHLYYVFERPIPLWKNVFEKLTEIKKYLTPRIWTQYVTTAYNAIQYESINQPFRCVGSKTKGNSYVIAFKSGEKITIEYLNRFLPEDKKLDNLYKSSCSLEKAKELYPDWYQRRIIEKKERGHFNRYQPIYYNWIEKILDGAVVGHRYNCLENLCSLAVQCQIDPEQVEKDCRKIAERFEELTIAEDNHFTEYDIICALKTYYTASEQAYRRKIEYISKKTGIELIPNKRNYQKQEWHLEDIRDKKENMKKRGQPFKNPEGRPKKNEIVQEWKKNNPAGKKIDCHRDTGLSRVTIDKWWN